MKTLRNGFVGFVLLSAKLAVADLSGFNSFAPVNFSGPAGNYVGYSPDRTTFELTDGSSAEAASGFASIPQNITDFTASFIYTCDGNDENPQYVQGDGFDFVIQNDPRGTLALGGDGGSKGYLAGTSPVAAAIAPSAAIGCEIYGTQTISYLSGGTNRTTQNLSAAGNLTALNGSDPIVAHVSYSGGVMSMFLTEPSTEHFAYFTASNVNLAATVGGSTALIGLSGGTGNANAVQFVKNFAVTASENYTPIAIAAGSFDQAMIIPASAPANGATAKLTATMDGGTARTGSTFYEQGFDPANTTYNGSATGLPRSGSTFTSQADANHVFQMQPYTGDDAILLNSTNGTGTLTFANPQAYSSLSFLIAAGHGPAALTFIINYADGTASSILFFSDAIVAPDWFGSGSIAWDANGRAYPSATGATTYDSVGSGDPNLFQEDLNLPDSTDPISSVELLTDSPDTSNIAVFAVSGVAVPEPASTMACIAVLPALMRRRRA
jgi:hypothetical protein